MSVIKSLENIPDLLMKVGGAKSLLEKLEEEKKKREEEKLRLLREETREICAGSLYNFVERAWHILEPSHPFVPGWHLEAICEHLEAVSDGDITRLLINVPPGSSKSLVTSVFWPAWEWGARNRPSLRYIGVAHNHRLSERDALRMRRLVTSDWYQWLWGDVVSLTKDQAAKIKFENTATGTREAMAAGSITGSRGDRVVCFPEWVRVHTELGLYRIGDIVRNKDNVRVWSTNTKTGKTELKNITGWHNNGPSPLVRVILSGGDSIVCTPDHKIWTDRGWVEACFLTSFDRIPKSPLVKRRGMESFREVKAVYVGGSAKETFCLTVEDNNTFYCGEGDGILVSNCDDSLSVESAASEVKRLAIRDWFLEALPTRLNNPEDSAIVVIEQRLHEEDVSGIILSKGLPYTHLCIPMEFDPQRKCVTSIGWEDPRTFDGELMCPERFSRESVERDKRTMGPFSVAGQFQQQPSPRGGGIIKSDWWMMWPPDGEEKDLQGKPIHPLIFPDFDYVLASLDTAMTEKQENDPSAFTIWGIWSDERDRPKIMLMDSWEDRLEFRSLVEKVINSCRRRRVDKLIIEAKANGFSVAQEIMRLCGGEEFSTSLIPVKGDKIARAMSVQHLFSSGIIYAPDRKFAQKVIDQFSIFPKGKNDDLVDSSVHAIRYLRDAGMALLSNEHEENIKSRFGPPGSIKPIYDV